MVKKSSEKVQVEFSSRNVSLLRRFFLLNKMSSLKRQNHQILTSNDENLFMQGDIPSRSISFFIDSQSHKAFSGFYELFHPPARKLEEGNIGLHDTNII